MLLAATQPATNKRYEFVDAYLAIALGVKGWLWLCCMMTADKGRHDLLLVVVCTVLKGCVIHFEFMNCISD